MNHIIPEFKKRLERLGPDARGAFFVDGHGSRGNPKVMQAFSDARIDVFSFIAHASQAMQPLDLGYFKVFKSNLRRLRNNDITITSAEKRLELLLATKRALYHSNEKDSIISCFRVAGIRPLCPLKVLGHPSVSSPLPLEQQKKKKPTKKISISGKCLTSDECIKILVEKKSESKKKSRKHQGYVSDTYSHHFKHSNLKSEDSWTQIFDIKINFR